MLRINKLASPEKSSHPTVLLPLLFLLLLASAPAASQNLSDSIAKAAWYRGSVHGTDGFVYLENAEAKDAYLFFADRAVPEVVGVRVKSKSANKVRGYDGKRVRRYDCKTVRGYEGKRVKFRFEGEVNENYIQGDVSLSQKMALRTGMPREFEVYLEKEKLADLPDLPERYTEPIFGGVEVTKKVFYGMADGYYTRMAVEDGEEDYDYQQIVLEALDKMFTSPAQKVMISIFRQDPVLLADLGDKPLYIDIYEPKDDTLSHRPLVLLLHGGAFIMGNRECRTMTEIATDLAQRGYVVASIDYRLGFNPGSKSSLERAAYRAVQDARAALRYLSHNADTFRIDMNRTFLAGSSAGAITALNTAFMREEEKPKCTSGNAWRMQKNLGGLDESGNEYPGDWHIQAVANLWGAIHDTTLIDPWERIPVISFHGDQDSIVPIGYDYPFSSLDTSWTSYVVSKMYGSEPISERLYDLGIQHELVIFPGLGHEPQTTPLRYQDVMGRITEDITAFFANSFFDWPDITGPDTISPGSYPSYYEVTYTYGIQYFWKLNGGKIVSQNLEGNRIEVVWLGEKPELKVMMVDEVGAAKTLRLIINYEF